MKSIWEFNKTVDIKKDKNLGNTYTHPLVSDFIVKELSKIKTNFKNILEPSIGAGSFYYSSKKYLTYDNFEGFDIDGSPLELLKEENINLHNEDFLLCQIEKEYDLIITNPPYISFNNLKVEDKKEYLEQIKNTINWDKLGVNKDEVELRSDIFLYFYLKSLSLLTKDGYLVFLCSDKWLESNYGQILKKVLRENFNLEIMITSNFYPFFKDDTNAILTIITNKANGSDKTILKQIISPDFKTKDIILERKDFIKFYNAYNSKNKIVLYPKEYIKSEILSKNLHPLSELVDINSGSINFNKEDKNNNIIEDEENSIPLFYQKQSRVNKPAIYRELIFRKDLKYYLKDDNKYELLYKGVFYTAIIDLIPRLFVYNDKCYLSSKYLNIKSKEIDFELLPILMNNIITINNIEAFIKNGTKRSGRKNRHGVIKEIGIKKLLDIPVLDFRLLDEKTKEEILKNYKKYNTKHFKDLEELFNNKDYIKVQKILIDFFKINMNFDTIKENTLRMYWTRINDLEKLGLPLIDL